MNKKLLHFLGTFFLAAILSLLASNHSQAQVISGDLVGTVLDKTGAAVPGATIEAVNVETGVKYTTKANDAGEYRFTNLPVGAYHVSVSAANFATTRVNGFYVELNKTVTLPITLEVQGVSNTIEVSGAAQALDTTTAQVTNDFTSQLVEDLPSATAGSGVLNLSLLAAGVTTSGGVGVGTGPSVGGQRPRNNNFTIEGVDNNDTSVTGPLVKVPNDAVAEFSVLQNQFSPEFGHSSGGQFNTIVKSGTNEFHGMAYIYNQNRNYDALDTLQKLGRLTTVPRFDDNRFGGNFGGPILKNKLFFFADYEYEPLGQAGVPGGNVCAPTAPGYATINATPGLSATNVAQFEKYVPAGTIPRAGCTPIAWTNGTAIPTAGLSLVSPSYNNTHRLVTSMDYDFSSKDQLRGRYIHDNFGGIDTAATLPMFFTTIPEKYHLVAINEYHTFNPGLTNELRLGFNRFTNNFPAGNISYPGLDSFPNLVFDDLGFLQLGPDPSAPQYAAQNTYQVADSLTWTKSAHTFTFGIEGRKLIAPSSFTQRSRGDYEYVNMLSFFQDQVPDALAERSGGNSVYEGNRTAVYWFVNDNWRLRPNFTVNLGVRYEYTTIPYSETLQRLNAIASVPGLVTFAAPKAPTNDWEPRIGFAYSPGNSGRTSIRAGFSIAYDVLFDNLGLLTLPPELSVTNDCTPPAPAGTATCPNPPFLANGGIPPGKGGITTYPTQAAAAFATSAYLPVNTKYPKALNWNLGVQHSFAKDYTVEIRYVGTRGLFLPVQTRLNAASQVTPTVFLPTYTTAPSQATLNALPYDLNGILNGAYGNGDGLVPAWENAGFFGHYVTSYQPWGESTYHGLAAQVNKHLSHGLQWIGSYTFSHALDNSTAEVFSTVLAPRRPQDFQNFGAERANSILDHRHRMSLAVVYNLPLFREGHWLERNLLGNWELDPIYTFQSGQWVTAQSGIDSNLNGDSASDRAIWNAAGVPGTGSGVIPLCNNTVSACPATVSAAAANPAGVVAYLATHPNARYIQAGYGAKATVGRNTLQLPAINDVDLAAGKSFTLTERVKLSFYAQAFNVFNHAQWVGGYINDVAPIGYTGSERGMLEPQRSIFNQPSAVFSSNPRTMQLALKLVF